MSKYDRMIEVNKKRSEEKITAAKAAIRRMLEGEERDSIPRLMQMTGLARGLFYKNPEIRSEINRALVQQAGVIDPRRNILDKAMDGRIELLQRQVAELKRENESLRKENQKLRKSQEKKDWSVFKNL